MRIRERCSAGAAERSYNPGRRSVGHRAAGRERVVGCEKDQPSDGLSSHRSATVSAMANRDPIRLAGNQKTNRTAATSSEFILHRTHQGAPDA